MLKDDVIILSFDEKEYKIDLKKLTAILSYLEGRKIVYESKEQIERYLEKYFLYDDVFLSNVNRL